MNEQIKKLENQVDDLFNEFKKIKLALLMISADVELLENRVNELNNEEENN